MSQMTKVICDHCGKDITSTQDHLGFRLFLTAEPLPHVGHLIPTMMSPPPIKEARHFCALGCLKAWVEREVMS